jgi:hypothetical protein
MWCGDKIMIEFSLGRVMVMIVATVAVPFTSNLRSGLGFPKAVGLISLHAEDEGECTYL